MTAPVISNVVGPTVDPVGKTVTFTWDTDIPATDWVEYGIGAYSWSQGNTGVLSTSHSVVLTVASLLVEGQDYQARVASSSDIPDTAPNTTFQVTSNFTPYVTGTIPIVPSANVPRRSHRIWTYAR